jgi:hypothetical protein
MIFKRMTDIEERFADYRDDRWISDIQLLGGLRVKGEFRSRPAKNRVANLTPLRFCW